MGSFHDAPRAHGAASQLAGVEAVLGRYGKRMRHMADLYSFRIVRLVAYHIMLSPDLRFQVHTLHTASQVGEAVAAQSDEARARLRRLQEEGPSIIRLILAIISLMRGSCSEAGGGCARRREARARARDPPTQR